MQVAMTRFIDQHTYVCDKTALSRVMGHTHTLVIISKWIKCAFTLDRYSEALGKVSCLLPVVHLGQQLEGRHADPPPSTLEGLLHQKRGFQKPP